MVGGDDAAVAAAMAAAVAAMAAAVAAAAFDIIVACIKFNPTAAARRSSTIGVVNNVPSADDVHH